MMAEGGEFAMQREVTRAIHELDPTYRLVHSTDRGAVGAALSDHPVVISQNSDGSFKITKFVDRYGKGGLREIERRRAEAEKVRLRDQLGLGLDHSDPAATRARLAAAEIALRAAHRSMRHRLFAQMKQSSMRVVQSRNGGVDPYHTADEYLRELQHSRSSHHSPSTSPAMVSFAVTRHPTAIRDQGVVTLGYAMEPQLQVSGSASGARLQETQSQRRRQPSNRSPVAFSLVSPTSPEGSPVSAFDNNLLSAPGVRKKASFFTTQDDEEIAVEVDDEAEGKAKAQVEATVGAKSSSRSIYQRSPLLRGLGDSVGGHRTPGMRSLAESVRSGLLLPSLASKGQRDRLAISVLDSGRRSVDRNSLSGQTTESEDLQLKPTLSAEEMLMRHNRLAHFQDVPMAAVLARDKRAIVADQGTGAGGTAVASPPSPKRILPPLGRQGDLLKRQSAVTKHTEYELHAMGHTREFYQKEMSNIEHRATDRRLKYYKKYKALSLTGPPLPFRATPQAILHHVEKVINLDEQLSTRLEAYARESAWFAQLQSYCRDNYSHPTVQRMMDKAATFIALDKPSPDAAQFHQHILSMVTPTEILVSDVAAASVHIAKVFGVPKDEAIAALRGKARGFIVERVSGDLVPALAAVDSKLASDGLLPH